MCVCVCVCVSVCVCECVCVCVCVCATNTTQPVCDLSRGERVLSLVLVDLHVLPDESVKRVLQPARQQLLHKHQRGHAQLWQGSTRARVQATRVSE